MLPASPLSACPAQARPLRTTSPSASSQRGCLSLTHPDPGACWPSGPRTCPAVTGCALTAIFNDLLSKRSTGLSGHLDEEQPRVDHAAGQARHRGRDQPVQATAGLHQEGEPGGGDEHRGDRVGGEPFDVALHAPIGSVTGSPVQDEQGYAETTATASSSQPRAAAGWGATSKTATSTEVMNNTRV